MRPSVLQRSFRSRLLRDFPKDPLDSVDPALPVMNRNSNHVDAAWPGFAGGHFLECFKNLSGLQDEPVLFLVLRCDLLGKKIKIRLEHDLIERAADCPAELGVAEGEPAD